MSASAERLRIGTRRQTGLATASDELALIYAQNFRTLLAYARSNRADDPEDVVHESILKAAERVNLAELSVPASYLTLVTKRTILGRRRRQATAQRHFPEDGRVDEVDGPEQETEAEDQSRQLRSAMSKLSPRQQLLLILHSEGIKPAEIARLLSTKENLITANEVSCAISRGRKTLRKRLLDDGFVPVVVPGLGWIKQLRHRFAAGLTPLTGEAGHLTQMLVAAALVVQVVGAANQPNQSVDTNRSDRASVSGLVAGSQSASNALANTSLPPSMNKHPSPASVAKTNVVRVAYSDKKSAPRSPEDQLVDLVNHPEKVIPLPGCSGLSICPQK